MVLKSGAKCSVSHMTSTLRCASRSSRLNPIQITVDVQLAKQARMVARPSRDGRLCTREPQSRQIQFIDKQVRTGLSSPMKSSRDSGISTICSRLFPSMYLFIACSNLCLTHRQRTGKMVHCVFTQPRSGLDSHLFEFIARKPPLNFVSRKRFRSGEEIVDILTLTAEPVKALTNIQTRQDQLQPSASILNLPK